MTQTTIVYIIIAITFLYVLYVAIKKIRAGNTDHCGDCQGCSLKKECGLNSFSHDHKLSEIQAPQSSANGSPADSRNKGIHRTM